MLLFNNYNTVTYASQGNVFAATYQITQYKNPVNVPHCLIEKSNVTTCLLFIQPLYQYVDQYSARSACR